MSKQKIIGLALGSETESTENFDKVKDRIIFLISLLYHIMRCLSTPCSLNILTLQKKNGIIK